MAFHKVLFLLLLFGSSSVVALAGEIYKTVDENGNVVFSDKKTYDAEKVQVQSNVVDVNTPVMPESTTQEKPKQQAYSQPQVIQQEVTVSGANTGANARRRVRTQTNGEGIDRHKQPVATSAAGAGGRR
jgi:hypothetical protein